MLAAGSALPMHPKHAQFSSSPSGTSSCSQSVSIILRRMRLNTPSLQPEYCYKFPSALSEFDVPCPPPSWDQRSWQSLVHAARGKVAGVLTLAAESCVGPEAEPELLQPETTTFYKLLCFRAHSMKRRPRNLDMTPLRWCWRCIIAREGAPRSPSAVLGTFLDSTYKPRFSCSLNPKKENRAQRTFTASPDTRMSC